MALPTTSSFSGLVLQVENSPGAGAYTARMCGFSDKGLALKAQSSTAIVPDCDDPEAPSWDISGISSLGVQITLSGISASEDEDFWNDWFDSGASKKARWIKTGVGYREGDLLLTDLGETVKLRQDGNLSSRSITLQNASAFPYTSGDPA
jgi:hypothetical protein